MQGVLIQAIVCQKGDLVWNLIDELETCNVVGMYSAFFRTEQEPVITCANIGEKGALFADCADEFTLAIQD